jgi:hypothetical protein
VTTGHAIVHDYSIIIIILHTPSVSTRNDLARKRNHTYYVNSSYRRSAWLGKVQPLGGPDAVMDYVYAVAYTAYIS